jgi:opacity protein-like surface antigen
MKFFIRTGAGLGLCLGLAVAPSVSIQAENNSGGVYLSTEAGGALLQDADITGFAGLPAAGEVSFEPGLRVGVAIGYAVPKTGSGPRLRAEVESGLLLNDADEISGPGGSVSLDATLYQVPVLLNFAVDFVSSSKLTPYLGVGGGGLLAPAQVDNVAGTASDTSDTAVVAAYQAFAGLRWALSERAELGLAYKFLGTPGPTWNFDGTKADVANLFTHSVLVTFRGCPADS